MQRVLINLQNYVMGEAIEQTLKNAGDFQIEVVENPEEVVKKQFGFAATVVLMEVTGYTPYKLCERMLIRDKIRKQDPQCRIVLMVDENANRQLATQVKQLKKDGLIDQFIYGSTSAAFLAALMETV